MIKTGGDDEGIYVNDVFSGGRTETTNFTAYINPYLVVSRGGSYTKHIYIGSQRIVSKLGDLDSYGSDPRRIEYAGSNVDGASVNYQAKYKASQQQIKDNYAEFKVPYYGTDNNDYVNGIGFCCNDSPNQSSAFRAGMANDNPELFQYYYHSDHLGSTSLITDLDGNVVQHVEYVPYGEVFIEERNNTWNTPYLFNAKELDEETGLYYYGARYLDPRVSNWMSADPLQEKYPNISTYCYTANNSVRYVDSDGKKIKLPIGFSGLNALKVLSSTLTPQEASYIKLNSEGFIDLVLMKFGLNSIGNKNVSGNYLALIEIVQNDKVVEFSAPMNKIANDVNGNLVSGEKMSFQFHDPEKDEYNNNTYELVGGVGITLAPSTHKWTKNDRKIKEELPPEQQYYSTDENYQVLINGRGLKYKSTYKDLVATTAHELYGHLLMMFRGKDALHTPMRSGKGANTELENQIDERVNEAERNFDNK